MSGKKPKFYDRNGIVIDEEKIDSFTPVFPFMVFEYLAKNGLSSIISDNIKKEWSIGRKFNNCLGFISGTHSELSINKDFLAFQKSMLKEIF